MADGQLAFGRYRVNDAFAGGVDPVIAAQLRQSDQPVRPADGLELDLLAFLKIVEIHIAADGEYRLHRGPAQRLDRRVRDPCLPLPGLQ